ncbi:hypothetical protein [Craterilacuibacter sinensis]|uniref:Uncharacterized protein n=1 Tax=Craterilacuibacter sinensis TaxID=2686017 RepID=A0A845BNH3_9NEIS|nr:hypothetical protein [Craterilacuibacter sinensis]MXR37829.1 hypothetical protein [Craterilacuibacter sinensis]
MKEPWQYLKSSTPLSAAGLGACERVGLLRRRSIAGELYRPLPGQGAPMVFGKNSA